MEGEAPIKVPLFPAAEQPPKEGPPPSPRSAPLIPHNKGPLLLLNASTLLMNSSSSSSPSPSCSSSPMKPPPSFKLEPAGSTSFTSVEQPHTNNDDPQCIANPQQHQQQEEVLLKKSKLPHIAVGSKANPQFSGDDSVVPLSLPIPRVSLLPVDVQQDSPNNKKAPRIPRPMNSFMLFSKERRNQLRIQHPDFDNKEISKMLGEEWNSLSLEAKEAFGLLAKKVAEEHQQMYPDWKFVRAPRRKNLVKKPSSRIPDPSLNQGPIGSSPYPKLYPKPEPSNVPVPGFLPPSMFPAPYLPQSISPSNSILTPSPQYLMPTSYQWNEPYSADSDDSGDDDEGEYPRHYSSSSLGPVFTMPSLPYGCSRLPPGFNIPNRPPPPYVIPPPPYISPPAIPFSSRNGPSLPPPPPYIPPPSLNES